MSLRSRAPTRIDLAGGTLDIWPLYLLLEQAATVNVAVDLYAQARIEPAEAGWRVKDEDSGRETEASSPAELERAPGAEIAGALLGLFSPGEPLAITTRCLAPPRSGLGASSALAVAIGGALNALTGFRYDGPRLIEIVKNVECRVLGAMTGSQDHYPGLYGGACCLWWGAEGARRESLPLDAHAFEERFLLAYTHQPHRSGVNNWEVIKRFLDGDRETRQALEAIGRIALSMREALASGDLDRAAALVGDEWEARRRLAPAVSSPELELVLERALAAGADAGKACGAGGGGCLLIAARKERREAVEQAVGRAGGSLVAFHLASRGLELDHPSGRVS